jgi:hypothetical protein
MDDDMTPEEFDRRMAAGEPCELAVTRPIIRRYTGPEGFTPQAEPRTWATGISRHIVKVYRDGTETTYVNGCQAD